MIGERGREDRERLQTLAQADDWLIIDTETTDKEDEVEIFNRGGHYDHS